MTHSLQAEFDAAGSRAIGDLLSASKSSSSAQDVILVSGLRNWSRGTVTPFFLDDMTVAQRCKLLCARESSQCRLTVIARSRLRPPSAPPPHRRNAGASQYT